MVPCEDADLLADLTPTQQEAVTHIEGPSLILAGPGSGKTRVITRRVAYMLRHGVRPSSILAITFTNKAAGEMRQRVEVLEPGNRVWISTFHSFGVRILRLYSDRVGLDRNFTIYDQSDRAKLVKAALEAAEFDTSRFTPDAIGGAISKAKNQLLIPEKYASTATDYFGQIVARIYPLYEKKLRSANALDFDDLLLWPALALKNDPELRAELDARFRFVMIDEYQDTNQAQYAIARGLSVDYPNLCVVGDADQSIYGWRGANIRNILNFEEDFPAARVLTLDRNYRSTKAILNAADKLISHNRQRKPHKLFTENAEGAPVRVLTYENGQHEADGIAKRIREAVKAGKRSYRDFAIFLRINALSLGLEKAFVSQRVPYQIVRGVAFYDRKENRDVLAYLRLLLNPRDGVSFERVVNEPARGVGKVSLEHLRTYAESREISMLAAAAEVEKIGPIKGKAALALRNFAQLISDLRQRVEEPPQDVIRLVLDRTGYRRMLQDSHDEEDEDRLANVEQLITDAKQFAAEDSSRTIDDYLENITLASDVDGWNERQDCVAVMTLHAAKGLEFPVVFMAAVEQGLLPHERSLAKKAELEEERRLAFVGMTRAKEELYLTHARLRAFRGSELYAIPSMFIDELPQKEIETMDLSASVAGSLAAMTAWREGGAAAAEQGWADAGVKPPRKAEPAKKAGQSYRGEYEADMIVKHAKYGRGKIVEVSGQGAMRKIKVRFATQGVVSFVANMAKLEVVGG
jgi:DNA helicase-2/ATP-dependent DNA helicase PcrA